MMYEADRLERKWRFQRRCVLAVQATTLLIATAGLTWAACAAFLIHFRPRYVLGVWAAGLALRMIFNTGRK